MSFKLIMTHPLPFRSPQGWPPSDHQIYAIPWPHLFGHVDTSPKAVPINFSYIGTWSQHWEKCSLRFGWMEWKVTLTRKHWALVCREAEDRSCRKGQMKYLCRQWQVKRQEGRGRENLRESLLLRFLIAPMCLILVLSQDAVRHMCNVVNSPPLPAFP